MITNERKAVGIIFANMHESSLSSLTRVRTMASVPFGGRYRLIDFPLSSFVNANIFDVGVITKANYQSLMDHVGSGREWDLTRKRGGLHILPPYGNKNYGVYHGKIEALGAALDYLNNVKAKQVVLSDCELVMNADLAPFMEAHRDSGADITLMYTKAFLNSDEAQDSTIVSFDENNRLVEVMCNPEMSGEFNYLMNVVTMDRTFLIKLVSEAISKGEYSFERDILQKRCKDLQIQGFYYDGFVRKASSIKSFFQANLDLLKEEVQDQLFCKDRPIYTKVRDEAPVHYGTQAEVKNSFIADGCIIDGEVENSIIFRGCRIAKGASVKNCILMQDTVVGEKCEMQYAITDKKVQVSDHRTIIATESFPAYIAKGTLV